MSHFNSSTAKYTRLICALVSLLLATGCQSFQQRRQVGLGEIYDNLAQLPDYERNPVIVIPGILGSKLIDDKTGEVVWGEMGPKDVSALKTRSLTELALPMQLGVPLSQLRDDVRENGPLDKAVFHILGIPIKVNAYQQLLATLGVGGYRDADFQGKLRNNEVDYGEDHITCFQFSYDWRRDVSESAAQLHQYIEETNRYTREQYRIRYGIENPNLKFDIVAHSMGGLVARYYLRYGNQPLPEDGSLPVLNWEGTRHVGRVFLVGTPNLWSTQTLIEMKEGITLAAPFPKFPPAVVGTIPSAYQLLPRNRDLPVVTKDGQPLDLFASETWQLLEWGLSDPAQDRKLKRLLPGRTREERLEIALDHQAKCLARAEQLHRSLDLTAEFPTGVEVHLYAGDAERTLHQLRVDPKNGRITQEIKTAGDSTVTRTSALAERRSSEEHRHIERLIPWNSETFLSADHLGLTRERTFVDNVLNQLTSVPGSTTQFHFSDTPPSVE